jgi:ribose transport system permease protein
VNSLAWWQRIFRDHATLVVLLVLCGMLSVATIDRQSPIGAAGGRQLAREIVRQAPRGARVMIVVRDTPEDADFADASTRDLESHGYQVATTIRGQPNDARQALERAAAASEAIDVIGASEATGRWAVFENLGQRFPALASAQLIAPRSYWWPTFLKTENLRNVVNQVADIAIVAIGMTMVIIAGGIDLSAGSLIALTAVVTARLIRDYAGGVDASWGGVFMCAMAGITCGALVGAFTGTLVTAARIPPFIVTLGVMSIASGLAFKLARGPKGLTIDEVPRSIDWLGRGADLFNIPNAVVLMLLLYLAADLTMKRTVFGRYLYAVGGNRQAAWLCGLRVKRLILSTYVITAALAGLAGLIQLSLFRSANPTYGIGYELRVIAAVVVGGTSLSGGEGKMIGTLLGALIMGVVQNGMNLLDIPPDSQPIVLGAVILAAALLDRLKHARTDD